MRRVLSLLLAISVIALLTACSGMKVEDVAGTWKMEASDTALQAEALLRDVDAYEEELALADLNSLKYVKVAEFREDGTYQFRVDAQGTKDCVRSFFEGYFRALYIGRSTLNEAYNTTFDDMTEEEFRQFYAQLYAVESFSALVDALTETAYDYQSLEKPMEKGTFTLRGDLIRCTIEGKSESSAIKAVLLGENAEQLKLTYSDGEEVYTRAG